MLGKESKCEILDYLEPTTGIGRNKYLFHCNRWLTEGGQKEVAVRESKCVKRVTD